MRKVAQKEVQWLGNELPILEQEGVLNADTAERIRSYYQEQTVSGLHWAIVAFAMLGALLIGSGIILLFAHNWEHLSRPDRAVLSLTPLFAGSVLSCLALVRKGGAGLREGAGIFHALAVGAAIALIGQTYHLPSDTQAFLLTWALLIMPLMFILRSGAVYLLYLALCCSWSGVAQSEARQAVAFWPLLLPAIIWLVQAYRNNRNGTDTLLGIWGLLFSLCIALGIVLERSIPGIWIVAYAGLLSASGLAGMYYYSDRSGWGNPLKVFGLIGMAVLTYLFTFEEMWDEIGWSYYRHYDRLGWGGWYDAAIALLLLSAFAFTAVKAFRSDSAEVITLITFPLLTLTCFLLGSASNAGDMLNALIFNGFMLSMGILFIVLGCRQARLRQVNGGMLILSVLLVTRFFDSDFGFMAKGLVFVVLGSCFLTANLVLVSQKRRKVAR